MINCFIDFLKKWKAINGRLERHDYWSALLVMLTVLAVFLWFGAKIEMLKFLPVIFLVAMIIPYTTATIRRLHDIGKSAVSMLLILIPVIGWICLFVELIQNGKTDKEIMERKNKKENFPKLASTLKR